MEFETFAKLGIMGWPLAFCSILALAIILERFIFMMKQSGVQEALYTNLVEVLEKHKQHPKNLRDDVTTLHLTELQMPFGKGLKALRIIGTITPILGLLGTVLGIIKSFQKIAATTGPVNPALIADGLWEALLTTAIGLTIALPCLLAAQGLKAWGDRIFGSLCMRLNRLSLSYELDEQEQGITDFPARKIKGQVAA